jgi:hypothetical protein
MALMAALSWQDAHQPSVLPAFAVKTKLAG